MAKLIRQLFFCDRARQGVGNRFFDEPVHRISAGRTLELDGIIEYLRCFDDILDGAFISVLEEISLHWEFETDDWFRNGIDISFGVANDSLKRNYVAHPVNGRVTKTGKRPGSAEIRIVGYRG